MSVVFSDYVIDGTPHGPVARKMGAVRFDPGLYRPFFDDKGNPCVSLNTGRMTVNKQTGVVEPIYKTFHVDQLPRMGIRCPVANDTSMHFRSWIELDDKVRLAARQRLAAWDDLAKASTYSGFDGFARTTLEYEATSDFGFAQLDMEGWTPGRNDNPLFKLRSLPLPIAHADFVYGARRNAISHNTSMPLDARSAEAGARRVAELLEQMVIGLDGGIEYGTQSLGYGAHDGLSKIYGYTTFPPRIAYTMAIPTGGAWTANSTINDLLGMIEALKANRFYGPYKLYITPAWDKYLNRDYILTGGNVATQTLRQRLEAIPDLKGGIGRLDFWTGSPYQMVLVQMTGEVARAVIGMPLTTVQWEEKGGMELHFKVMCIMVPQLFSDYNSRCGILHATAA